MHKPLMFGMILILALGTIGTASAGWSDAVLIRADAASGDLAVGLSCLSIASRCCQDEECGEEEPGVTLSNGCFSFELSGSPYYESVDLTFTNPSPCFTPGCCLEIANGGTIPARIKNLSLEWWGDEGTVASPEWTIVLPDDCQESGSGAGQLRNILRGAVLDPGQKISVEIGFQFRNRGDLTACSIRVDCVPWNQNA